MKKVALEKLTLSGHRKSRDGAFSLIAELSDPGIQKGKYCVCIKVALNRVHPATIAVLVYLDGGPRNFIHLSSVSMRCKNAPGDRG